MASGVCKLDPPAMPEMLAAGVQMLRRGVRVDMGTMASELEENVNSTSRTAADVDHVVPDEKDKTPLAKPQAKAVAKQHDVKINTPPGKKLKVGGNEEVAVDDVMMKGKDAKKSLTALSKKLQKLKDAVESHDEDDDDVETAVGNNVKGKGAKNTTDNKKSPDVLKLKTQSKADAKKKATGEKMEKKCKEKKKNKLHVQLQ